MINVDVQVKRVNGKVIIKIPNHISHTEAAKNRAFKFLYKANPWLYNEHNLKAWIRDYFIINARPDHTRSVYIFDNYDDIVNKITAVQLDYTIKFNLNFFNYCEILNGAIRTIKKKPIKFVPVNAEKFIADNNDGIDYYQPFKCCGDGSYCIRCNTNYNSKSKVRDDILVQTPCNTSDDDEYYVQYPYDKIYFSDEAHFVYHPDKISDEDARTVLNNRLAKRINRSNKRNATAINAYNDKISKLKEINYSEDYKRYTQHSIHRSTMLPDYRLNNKVWLDTVKRVEAKRDAK